MNRIYKLKFDKRRNELVVVSEITAGMGKEKSTGHIADLASLSSFRKLLGTLTPVALLTGLISGLLPAMVLAADLPTGGQIVGGQGSISTSGNQMTIHQQTQNMATNWHSFDIGKNNTVQFVQPDSSSVALNRVTGASGSQIMGTLKANGQVFILNPNGVLFGKNARVDVGGLVASTKNISTADFMKGQYTLSGEGNPGAQVINQGSLTTSKGGYIVLAGERVSNSGTVTTPGGKTVLAAGKTVTLQLDNSGLTSVSVNGSVVNALVENRGLISATNGQVYLTAKGQDMLLNTVVNNSGTVEAKGLASRGGEIVLSGGDSGVVSQSGQLLADSQTGQGGKITLEGQNIHLAGNSLTSATGKTGGGEVYVGGGWQGKDSRIRNASKVVMDKTATVDVSATDAGNGGTAVLWSDDYTNFRGTVLAKGGAQSGNGGRVETSSHQNLQASGTVEASSPSGKGGEWLLDPTDVTIVGSGADSNIDSTTNAGIFTPTASGAQILNSSIVNQLNTGTSVTVKTSGVDVTGQTGNITVNANIVKTAGADAKLTLIADNNITTNKSISIGASTGKLDLDLLAGNTTNNASVVLGQNINISLNGGDFLAGAANPDNAVSLTYSNNGQIHGGNVTLNLTRGLSGYAYKVQADNNLTISGPVSGNTGWKVPLSFIAGENLEMNSPTSISLSATDTANGGAQVMIKGGGNVSLNSKTGITIQAANTNNVNINSDKGDITLKADNGSVLISGATSASKANIISGGNITISGNGGSALGVGIINASINATGNMNITGSSSGNGNEATKHGGVFLFGNVSFSAQNGTLTGMENTSGLGSGIVMGLLYGGNTNLSFDGSFNINGVVNTTTHNGSPDAAGIYYNGPTNITFSGGDSVIEGRGNNMILGMGGAYTAAPQTIRNITLTDANLTMNLFSDSAFALNQISEVSGKKYSVGLAFFGNGNVSINGHNNDSDNQTMRLNYLNNTNLNGSFSVNASNDSGSAITLHGKLNAGLVNASINGNSGGGGCGVQITTTSGNTSLGNNTITGVSKTGNGIYIGGNNITITDGVLNGTSSSGNQAGVVLAGGSNFTLDGVSVIGNAADGSGVSVNGTLTVNNGTSLEGFATGSGNGVTVSGNLTTANGGGIILNGTATSGDGIKVGGDTSLMNATLNGSADSGVGVNIAGNLTTNRATQVNGHAAIGTGVNLGGSLTGGKVDGVSGQGTGLQLADNAVVTDATLKGTSTSGSGVAVTGNISLDDTTAAALNATSGSGAGLSLEDSANVSIVSITTVTQEKKGPDGNTVTDATGNPVMETITMTTPVTTPVTLTGISQSGSGVATSGNVSISGVVLNGSSTSAGGSGATLGGNLTIADDISGITVNATGNGTGLVVDNVTVNTDGYTSTGKNFVINASTSDIGGTAIRTQGNNQLAGVTLNGSAGNGGTAVELGGQVSGASVTGTSDSGTAVRVSDARLTNTVVTGNATGNGTGVALSGAVSLDKTTAEALNAVSSGGTGLSLEQSANVIVTGLDAATTAELKGISQSGSGITTAGNVAIRGIVLNGSTSTSGVGVTLGGNLTIGDHVSRVTAGATGNGTALVIDNATLQANGYAGKNKGPVILATASEAGGTAVKIQGDNQLNDVAIVGNASPDGGTGVLLDGQVTGANISGTAGSGTAVVVTDGTIINGGTVKGGAHSGTGLATDGNVTLNHALISGDAQGDSGTGVSLNGSITGGSVNGTSTSGDAVRIKDALLTGTEVNGVSQSGVGVKTQGNVTLKSTELSATSENGITDLDVSGTLNHDQNTVMRADRVVGQENIHELQPDTPPSPEESGATGSGGNTTPDTGSAGGVTGGDTGSGESGETVTPPSGGTGGNAGDNGNTGSATGGEGSLPENNVAQRGEAPGPAIRERMTGQMFVSVLRQQAVDAQVIRMNQAAQDGFHSAATPVVPVAGYQAKPQKVEISLCDEDGCQPESLDAARPAEGVVTSSGK